MSEVEKSRGVYGQLFGSKSSRCCSTEFQEVTEADQEAAALEDRAGLCDDDSSSENHSRLIPEENTESSAPT